VTFEHPTRLIVAALVAVAFVLAYRAIERRGARIALEYSSITFAERTLRSRVPYGALLLGLWTLALLALGIAFGGPHFTIGVPARDGAVVLCIDTSGSMASDDVAPSRAAAASDAARRFVGGLPTGARMGIVAFSTAAAVVAPLSSDRDAVEEAIDRIPRPNGGTAIGDALAAAARQLPERGHRAIVLVTDGVNNAGIDPIEAARAIGARSIAIYTVGIGTNSGMLVPGTRDEAQIDEEALRTIAEAGHGNYARVANADELRGALGRLAQGTVWERRRFDASLAFAAGGGIAMVLTFLGGAALGKFP